MLNPIKKLLLILSLTLKAFYGNSQEPIKYTQKQLQEDYSILKKALETTWHGWFYPILKSG